MNQIDVTFIIIEDYHAKIELMRIVKQMTMSINCLK